MSKIQLGNTVYYLDTNKKDGVVNPLIQEGIVLALNLTEGGYAVATMVTKDRQKKTVELPHCHLTMEEAEAHKERVMPIILEAERLGKEFDDEVGKLRIEILGKPEYLEVAKGLKV